MGSSKYEKMYLISEQEYNMRFIQPQVTLPTYKSPELKAEEHSFKMLGDKYENTADQLYKEVIKYSHVNDKNEWFEKRDDTLPIAGTNIIDLISYSIKPGITDKPYGWSTFVEFLKSHKNIPRVLLTSKVSEELTDPKIIPLSTLSAVAPAVSTPAPVAGPSTTPPSTPTPQQPQTPFIFPKKSRKKAKTQPPDATIQPLPPLKTRTLRRQKLVQLAPGGRVQNQTGDGLQIYF